MPNDSKRESYDALVLGGGPAGATAGLLLAKAGWRVAIVEKASFPRRKVCGEFISATTLPLLFELGIGDQFLASAGPEVRRVGLYEQETILSAPMPRPPLSAASWGRALGRDRFDLLLLNAAAHAGAKVWQPYKATALQRRETGWVCTIEGDERSGDISAPIVIAAMGSWERGPLPVQSTDTRRDSDLLAFKAHFRETSLAADLMPLLVFPGGYGGMVHSDGGRVSLSCCIRRGTLRRCREERPERAADAVLRHIRNSCSGARKALEHARLEGACLAAGPIRPGIRRLYANGLFFAGNIAGEAHPIIAEGISMAMQSAWLLCQRLIAEEADDAGRAYADEWRSAFALRIRAAAVFAHLAMRPNAATILRPVLKQFPAILTIGAHLAGKASPLCPAVRG